MQPVVLDFDGSVGPLPGERRIAMRGRQEALRLACTTRALRSLEACLARELTADCGTVFTGSGDFHHVTSSLVLRHRAHAPLDVLVFDNHPDNMRHVGGVHCGSWVRRVALLPFVGHVQVMGITSADVSAPQAWANYLLPLWRRRLSYWCVGVETAWARRLGLAHAVIGFDSPAAMLDRFCEQQRRSHRPVYVSIDKDVLHPDEARTNWDQGALRATDVIEAVTRLRGRVVGSDVTGDVSQYRYASRWKRLLRAIDHQPAVDAALLPTWQARQHALNLRLLGSLAAARASSV